MNGGPHEAYEVAVCQFEPQFLDMAANLQTIADLSRRASALGAQLALFPECCVTGYGTGELGADVAARAEVVRGPDRGPAVRLLETLADELNLHLVVGMPERDDGAVYNAAVHVAPGGGAISSFRKVHMWAGEEAHFTSGEGFSASDAPSGMLASLICFDLEFPEAARAAVVAGATLVAVSTANMKPWEEYQYVYARARAMENSTYVAVANCVGRVGADEFFGQSLVVDPWGTVLDRASGGEAILTCTIDPSVVSAARARLGYFEHRKPETYGCATAEGSPTGTPGRSPSATYPGK